MAGATVATLSRKPCMSEHCSPPSQTLSFMSLPWSQGHITCDVSLLALKAQQFVTSVLAAARCLGWLQPLAAYLQLYRSSLRPTSC